MTFDDLCQLPAEDDPKIYAKQLNLNWINEQLASKTKNRKPSLFRALTRTFFWSHLKLMFALVISECTIIAIQPLAIGILTRYFSDRGAVYRSTAIMAAILLPLSYLIKVIVEVRFALSGKRLDTKTRGALQILIYEKILKLCVNVNTFLTFKEKYVKEI